MGHLIKAIRHVQLWTPERYGLKLNTDMANNIRSPKTTFQNNNSKIEYENKYKVPTDRLEKAISIAPVMAQVAVDRLTSLLMDRDATAFLPPSQAREKALNSTVLAIYKYFNFPHDLRALDRNDANWTNVEKILGIYERTLEGMRQPYKIRLYDSGEKAHGFVTHTPWQDGDGPLDHYFRTAPSEDGHIKYPTWIPTSDINIRIDILAGPLHTIPERSDSIAARLLLHEATHKWANTVDICYKWDTIAQKNRHKEWEVAESARKSDKAKALARAIKMGEQPSLVLPDRSKPLLPLAKSGVAVGDWVYNADSYACAARRLWKEETRGGTEEYANWVD